MVGWGADKQISAFFDPHLDFARHAVGLEGNKRLHLVQLVMNAGAAMNP